MQTADATAASGWSATASGVRAQAVSPALGRPARRLSTEIGALRLMERHRIETVPRVLGVDGGARLCAVELDRWPRCRCGRATADIDAAVHIPCRDPSVAASAWAVDQPLAAEACLCGEEIERQIEARLARLMGSCGTSVELLDFIDDSFSRPAAEDGPHARKKAAMRRGLDFGRELPQEWRSLVPSDFGFHNSYAPKRWVTGIRRF